MIVQAHIKSINRGRSSTTDEPGISIVCHHDDGSEWGKKIYNWIWLDSKNPGDYKRWANLIEIGCTLDRAKELITGPSWELIGMKLDLQIDDSSLSEKFWKIINIGSHGTMKESTAPATEDIPF